MKVNITKLTINKISWLINHPSFQRHPLGVLLRVIYWEGIRVRGRPIVITFDNDIKLCLYPNDGVSRLIYYFNYSEPEVFTFIKNILTPGMVFVDVGANIGEYSLFVSKYIAPSGRVFAFEPRPDTFDRLRENVEKNRFGNLEIVPFALDKKTGQICFCLTEDSARSHVLNNNNIAEGATTFVTAISLDEFVNQKNIYRLDYLKIDVEGYEQKVIEGAQQSIRAFRPVIQFEMSSEMLSRYGTSREELYILITNLGYSIYALIPKRNLLRRVENFTVDYGNFFAIAQNKIECLSSRGLIA